MIIVAYIWIQTLTCSILGEIWVGRYSCSIFCLACVFLESDHSIFSLLHFPLGKSTLGQAASCSPTTKVSERHLVANEISIQKKNLHKSIPIQVNVGSPEKRQSAQARAWMPGSKGNAPFIPTFFILSPSTQKLGYKSQSSWKRGVAPVWKCKKKYHPLAYLLM